MRRALLRLPLRWAIPGIAAFLLVLVVRLPAAWFQSLLPATIGCAVVDGTLWSGSCIRIRIMVGPARTITLDKASWSLRPAALLRARLAAKVQIDHGDGEASAMVSFGASSLSVDSLAGRLQVDHELLPALPAGWHADISARDVSFTLADGGLARLAGTALVHGITDARNDPLGSYEITFGTTDGPPFVGRLHDSGGPLAVQAEVRIEPRGAWQVDGRVTPRPSAPAGLARQVRVLGLPAADGSYPFSVAGE